MRDFQPGGKQRSKVRPGSDLVVCVVITINYDDNIKNFICPPGHNSTSGDSPPAQTPAPTSLNVPAINIIGANQRVSQALSLFSLANM